MIDKTTILLSSLLDSLVCKDKNLIINDYLDKISELFPKIDISYHSLSTGEMENNLAMLIEEQHFGYIHIDDFQSFTADEQTIIKNSVHFLAKILEKVKENESLLNKVEKREKLAELKLKEADRNNEKLKKARVAALNLIEDLKEEIEKRKESERKLKESEENFRHLFEYSTVGNSITQLDGTVKFNKAFCNIVGYSEEELNSTKWMKITHPDDIEKSYEIVNLILNGELKTGRFEKRYIHKNGNIVWVDVSTYLQKDGNGKPQFFITSAIDITKSKRAAEVLRQSEEMMRNSQSVAHICSYSTNLKEDDLEKSIWECSPEFYKIFGIDETYPHTIAGWAAFIHPAYREKLVAYHENVVRNRTSFNHEYKIIRVNDGVERWVHGTGELVYDKKGKPVRMFGAIQDITELKKTEEELIKAKEKAEESEEKFRNLAESAQVAIAIIPQEHEKGYVYVNEYWQNLTGYSKEESTQMAALDLVHPDFREMIAKRAKQRLKGEDIPNNYEMKLLSKSGKTIWINFTDTMIYYEGKQAILSTSIDITEQKLAMAAIIESQRLGAIGEMSSAVAHDFNNSLQSITSYLELATLNTDLPEKVKRFLETASSSANDAANRVKLLQRFGGKKQNGSQFDSVNINSLINEVIVQSRPLWKDSAEKNGITISLETDLKKVDEINGNDAELKSVLYNLIKNSVEAIEKDGKIKIETESINNNVIIRIIDTGKGMSDDTKTRIFQPFFSTKGFESGRGLGLSGAYSIIREHKGEIYVKETSLGKGTTIEISLPLSLGAEKKIEGQKSPNYKGIARILWVDDDPLIRETALEILEVLGHEGDLADSGLNALELLDKTEYDLVFTDIGMPGMSGWQLCDLINEKYNGKMKLAVLSGWGTEIDNTKMKQHGVSYVLEKPFSIKQLQELINKAMQ